MVMTLRLGLRVLLWPRLIPTCKPFTIDICSVLARSGFHCASKRIQPVVWGIVSCSKNTLHCPASSHSPPQTSKSNCNSGPMPILLVLPGTAASLLRSGCQIKSNQVYFNTTFLTNMTQTILVMLNKTY